jgi:addiction module antidote protein, HigA family
MKNLENEPLHPGEEIKKIIKEKDIKQVDLALQTGINNSMLNGILKCKRSLTAKTAVTISRVLDIDPVDLMDIQTRYDIYKVENS